MTRDFIEDFKAACEKEGLPYVVFYQDHNGKDVSGSYDLTNWKTGINGNTTKMDVLQCMNFFIEDE
jgi:hypothetical protein